MVPPEDENLYLRKLFRLAHELRKRSDAIMTGSGTVLADHPSLRFEELLIIPKKNAAHDLGSPWQSAPRLRIPPTSPGKWL